MEQSKEIKQNWTASTEAVVRRCSMKKVLLEISQTSPENTCARVSFLINLQATGNFIKKETLAQVFSCKFSEISKNTFFTEHLWLVLLDQKTLIPASVKYQADMTKMTPFQVSLTIFQNTSGVVILFIPNQGRQIKRLQEISC